MALLLFPLAAGLLRGWGGGQRRGTQLDAVDASPALVTNYNSLNRLGYRSKSSKVCTWDGVWGTRSTVGLSYRLAGSVTAAYSVCMGGGGATGWDTLMQTEHRHRKQRFFPNDTGSSAALPEKVVTKVQTEKKESTRGKGRSAVRDPPRKRQPRFGMPVSGPGPLDGVTSACRTRAWRGRRVWRTGSEAWVPG
jgi:hypothetical protein